MGPVRQEADFVVSKHFDKIAENIQRLKEETVKSGKNLLVATAEMPEEAAIAPVDLKWPGNSVENCRCFAL